MTPAAFPCSGDSTSAPQLSHPNPQINPGVSFHPVVTIYIEKALTRENHGRNDGPVQMSVFLGEMPNAERLMGHHNQIDRANVSSHK